MSELRITSWNVNSLRSRLERVGAWLIQHQPDVLCLQETKCADADFPADELAAWGYRSVYTGQQNGLNGVAILTKEEPRDVLSVLPGRDEDEQRRFLSAEVCGLRVIDLYVPNGQALGSDAFFYKLDWLARLQAHLVGAHSPQDPLIVLGDFNITPDDRDLWDPQGWSGQLHCSPHERRALGYLEAWGLHDSLRLLTQEGGIYSWFDYRDTVREFDAQRGLRIDLIYVSEALKGRVRALDVDLAERQGEKPSDHAPVTLTLAAPE